MHVHSIYVQGKNIRNSLRKYYSSKDTYLNSISVIYTIKTVNLNK